MDAFTGQLFTDGALPPVTPAVDGVLPPVAVASTLEFVDDKIDVVELGEGSYTAWQQAVVLAKNIWERPPLSRKVWTVDSGASSLLKASLSWDPARRIHLGTADPKRAAQNFKDIATARFVKLNAQWTLEGALAVLPSLQELRTLDLESISVSDEFLAAMPALPNLTTLILDRCRGVGDAGVAHLTRHARLKSLNLQGTEVSDAGLASLAQLEDLKELRLALCHNINGSGLSKLKPLRVLGVEHNEAINDAALANLTTHAATLEELDLWNCSPITDAGLAHLAGMHRLRFLNLFGCQLLTDAGFAFLKGLTNLRELNLPSQNITDTGMAYLAPLTNMEKLRCSSAENVTSAGLSNLKDMKKLNELDISRMTGLSEDALLHVAPLTALEELDITLSGWLSDASLLSLKPHAKNLRALNLSFNDGLTDKGLSALKTLAELRVLNISECSNVTDAGIAELAPLKRLEVLVAARCDAITDAALVTMLSMPGLMHANFFACQGINRESSAVTNLRHKIDVWL